MPKIPDRWENYSNMGKVIPDTRFITFKVPLSEHLNRGQPEEMWFTPAILLEQTRADGQQLGLIIDLTFTTRYYQPQEFVNKGVQYEKIFVPGHIIPAKKIIKKFFTAVDNFLEKSDKDHLIGVHCTHGVNRTGYIVCRYMIERLGIAPEKALEAYATARGYPVERQNYIDDLHTRSYLENYGEGNDDDNDNDDEEEEVPKQHNSKTKHVGNHRNNSDQRIFNGDKKGPGSSTSSDSNRHKNHPHPHRGAQDSRGHRSRPYQHKNNTRGHMNSYNNPGHQGDPWGSGASGWGQPAFMDSRQGYGYQGDQNSWHGNQEQNNQQNVQHRGQGPNDSYQQRGYQAYDDQPGWGGWQGSGGRGRGYGGQGYGSGYNSHYDQGSGGRGQGYRGRGNRGGYNSHYDQGSGGRGQGYRGRGNRGGYNSHYDQGSGGRGQGYRGRGNRGGYNSHNGQDKR
ncbi:mRNA-capping enzyme-like [Mya arenaria]|uniref:mRNA-capping enzyme-like n=1 Tax=Mya arenaria TaxID=6604 RepID=UPI0022E91709|nr:mRNA-capping enzyme-like [Mya arenaria]